VFVVGLFSLLHAQERNGYRVIERAEIALDDSTPPNGTNTTVLPDFSGVEDPKEVAALIIVSVITTLLTGAAGKIPSLPRPVLPILAPLLGLLMGIGLKYAQGLPWWTPGLTLIAGAAGVGWREIVNQNITKRNRPLELSKTKARPIDHAVALNETRPEIPTREEARDRQQAVKDQKESP
jgi:hypothetical protein